MFSMLVFFACNDTCKYTLCC